MARLRLFGPARDAAGISVAELPGADVAAVLAEATARYGDGFASILQISRLWVNGRDVEADYQLAPDDEVAVLPPVSGG